MIKLKDLLFNQQWLETQVDLKCSEFVEHEKFSQRIQTIFLISKVSIHVSDRFINENLAKHLFKLGSDPVPNIKFNVSKTLQLIYPKLSNSNKEKCVEVLKSMSQDDERDFDVKFFAQKALEAVQK